MTRTLHLSLAVFLAVGQSACGHKVPHLGDCPPCGADEVCFEGACTLASCVDGVRSGDETGLDCGGSCQGCADGQGCLDESDCASGLCLAGACLPAHCNNGVVDENETGADCGGPACPSCATGEPCLDPRDCTNLVCNVVCQAATCFDGVQNGDETDTNASGENCGGFDCDPCGDGAFCERADDCASQICVGDTCQASGCADGVQNGNETDIDCGGPDCGACPSCVGGCAQDEDCASLVCMDCACQPPSCTDNVQNGDETGLDCGGLDCLGCDGDVCAADSGCVSGYCGPGPDRRCLQPACDDGAQNGGETGVDCGGSCPLRCDGECCCTSGSDCQSGVCDSATTTCAPPACDDDLQNGDETGLDCGGTCPLCDGECCCTAGTDCQSGVCDSGTTTCAPPACDDDVQNGDETGVDCGGSCPLLCDGCAPACSSDAQCKSGKCDANSCCEPPACDDGIGNGDEEGMDCGGSCPEKCSGWCGCAPGPDPVCASGACGVDGCCADPTCSDGVQNGDETGLDCGGSCSCCAGGACSATPDCGGTLSCVDRICQAAHCTDGVPSGDESDRDCGGSCAPCADTMSCGTSDECASRNCVTGVCAAPACSDGMRNGVESDTDCGGRFCVGCNLGQKCSSHWDCASLVCVAQTGGSCPACSGDACGDEGRCAAPGCADRVQNGDESGIDCGGSCPDACSPDPTCADNARNGDETGIDCGGSCPGCVADEICRKDSDCASGLCPPSGTCALPTCSDGVMNGGETGIDCGGSCPDACQPTCSDALQNGAETAVDCGGPDCPACPVLALNALHQPLHNAGGTLRLEGMFESATITVNLPGGDRPVATKLGPNRAEVAIRATASAGALEVTDGTVTSNSLPFRRPSFLQGLRSSRLRYEQAEYGRQIPQLADVRDGHTATVIGNYLYLVGGADMTSTLVDRGLRIVERALINADGTLGPFADSGVSLVQARARHATVVLGDYVYVIGGVADNGVSLSSIERASINPGGTLGAFSLLTRASLTGPRGHFAHEVIGNYVYVIGGSDDATLGLDTVERAPIGLGGEIGTFAAVGNARLRIGRWQTTAHVVGNKLYIIGGVLGAGGPGTYRKDVEQATIAGDGTISNFSVVQGVELEKERSGYASVVFGDALYVIGGYEFAASSLTSIERAAINPDSTLGAFTTLADVALVEGRWQAASAVIGNYVYLWGGLAAWDFDDAVGFFPIKRQSVERMTFVADGSLTPFSATGLPPLTRPNLQMAAITVGNFLYVIGGRDAGSPWFASVERAAISPDGSVGTFATVAGVSLTTGRAYHTAVQIRDWVYVISGAFAFGPGTTSIERARVSPDGSLTTFSDAGVALLQARTLPSAVVIGDSLYVFGGTDIERAAINADGSLGAFSVVSGVALNRARWGANAVVVGDRLYIVAGESGDTTMEWAPINADDTLGAFTLIPGALSTARQNAVAVQVGRHVYVGGGWPWPIKSVERATINSDGTLGRFSTAAGHTLLQNTYGSASAVLGNYVYVLGGIDDGHNASPLVQRTVITTPADAARGMPASAFDTYLTFAAGRAVDGDDATQWVANSWSGSQYLKVDLGSAKTIRQFRVRQTVNGTASHFRDLYLQSSSDDSAWTQHYHHAQAPEDTGLVPLSAPSTARYWRVLPLTQDGGVGTSPQIFTFELWDDVTVVQPRDADVAREARGAGASASNTWSTFKAYQAIDGNDTTQWVALNYPSTLMVDLGQPRSIDRWRIFWAANISAVDLQSSDDGSAWTSRATRSNAGGYDTGLIALGSTRTHRYWRLVITGPAQGGTGNGNSPQILTFELRTPL